jgi:uncharacterized protein (TIGR02271 family)
VEAIYYDTHTGEPEWIGVRSGFLPSRRILVPVAGALLDGTSLTVQVTRDQAEGAPAIAADELSPEEDERLYAYYGLSPPAASDEGDEPPALVRHEEELVVAKRLEEVGRVRARKLVESEHVEELVPYDVEHATIDRVSANEDDSGLIETLPDGSISIPVFEEEVVVEKQVVVRERVIIRKEHRLAAERIEADLRVERVDVDLGPGTESVLEPADPVEPADD